MRISDWSSDVCSSVLLNLVRNSVQAIVDAATSEREVRVSTSLNGENEVEVAVDDTGPGIPAAIAKRLFEPFVRSEEHTSELQSLMRISYAVFCLKKKKQHNHYNRTTYHHKPRI